MSFSIKAVAIFARKKVDYDYQNNDQGGKSIFVGLD